MKYPARNPFILFKRIDKDTVEIKNWNDGEIYHLSKEGAHLLKKLDGKHNPYEIMQEYGRDSVKKILREFKICNLLAPKKKLESYGNGLFTYPLIYCYPNKVSRVFSRIWNLILSFFFLPTFALGLYLHCQGMITYCFFSKYELFAGIFLGIIFGIVPHELSHICAGLSYNGHIFEIGVGVHYFLPMAYVLLDDSNVKSNLKKAQINAAGIEANMLLYGLFMCLSSFKTLNPFLMYQIGIVNLTMACINLLPLNGFDGLKIASNIMRKDDLLEYAKKTIRKSLRKRKNSSKDKITLSLPVLASYGLLSFQIVLPLLVVYEIYSWIMLIFYSI